MTLANGDRVLVANQTTKSENGIFAAGTTPTRATDADTAGELSGGTIEYVEQGTVYGGRQMRITTAGSITPGTTPHDWSPLTPKDHGLVEALPTSAALVGDRCTLKVTATGADATVYWDLLYNGEGERPWMYVGGPPLSARADSLTILAKNQTTYTTLPTEPLAITLPNVKGDWDIRIEGIPRGWGPASGLVVARLSYSVGATAASDVWGVTTFHENAELSAQSASDGSKETRHFAIPAGAKVEDKGRSEGDYEIAFLRRRLWIRPVRVG